ncbi:hypothetical protein SLEP1_g2263 [Rubroshorea leprosula]|uniref:Uncharacterized protein n=1 Tax=Rubroshorea leprosula TaxID=152421 RepID=A0AAV5HR22_9ROSI|nr:hypothetical protein SLEP1_g2263 [Rubroshorea leprosula]
MNNQTIRTDFGLLEDIALSLAVYARQPNTANRGRISNLEVSRCRFVWILGKTTPAVAPHVY